MASIINGVATSTSTSSTSTTSSTKSDAAAASIDYDSFLKLFMTELQNQDPTDPMDTTQQMAQLATFSQVEQQIKTNTNLASLISQNMLSQASGLIGKTIADGDGNTGVVTSIKVVDDSSTTSMTATLDTGKTVTIGAGSGITISAPQ